jgi:cyclophilin family peptidyl-prolyl cis-trans isomerase
MLHRFFYAAFLITLLTTAVSAGPLAKFRTVLGDIDVELFEDKPVTVKNFIDLVKSGAYTNTFFHRSISNFIVQGGGFKIANPASPSLFNLNQVFLVPNLGQITNEYFVGRRVSNLPGTIAMARLGGQTNSASTHWFFNIADNSFLDKVDGGFTVFGKVVGGMNVLDFFNQLGKGGNGTVRLQDFGYNDGGTFSDLPVRYFGNTPPNFDDLFYVDITLLNVKVATFLGGRDITWNSVSNRMNVVEFTTKFPPVWQTFTSVTGNGNVIKVTDTTPRADRRFYRVRVNY